MLRGTDESYTLQSIKETEGEVDYEQNGIIPQKSGIITTNKTMSDSLPLTNGGCQYITVTHSAPPISSHSPTVSVADVPKTNGVAARNAWIKPHISVEQADAETPSSTPSPSSVSSPPGFVLPGGRGCVNLGLCLRTHEHPKTPPANYRFYSPNAKNRVQLRNGSGEGSGDVEQGPEMAEGGDGDGRKMREDGKRLKNSERLQVFSSSPRTNSLPVGMMLEGVELHRISSNSDETAESEGSPLERRRVVEIRDQSKWQDSVGSDFSLPDSCSSSEDTSSEETNEEVSHTRHQLFKTSSVLEQEDDVFNDGEAPDTQEEADTKLINWATNDFVPACHQLLLRCSDSKTTSAQVKLANVQADLRSLSNVITFFCSEQQQRLSQLFQLKSVNLRDISQSVSTQTFPRPKSVSAVPNGGESVESNGDRSYAVKVLRSASHSLIAPLLFAATQREGFTPNLHQAIIKALQKIAWKVEACLSFTDPNNTDNIHAMIFNTEHIVAVRNMMIQALPPDRPQLPPKPCLKCRKTSEPYFAMGSPYVQFKRRGMSVKEHSSRVIYEVETPPTDSMSINKGKGNEVGEEEEEEGEQEGLEEYDEGRMKVEEQEVGEKEEEEEEEEVEEGKKEEKIEGEREKEAERKLEDEGDGVFPDRDNFGSQNSTPNLPRRERIATEGEGDLASQRLSRNINFGSIPNINIHGCNAAEGEEKVEGTRERYFRPKTYRRTTISLSRKEVQKLGLTVAKRVDESIIRDIKLSQMQDARRGNEECRNEDAEEEVKKAKERGSKGKESEEGEAKRQSAPVTRLAQKMKDLTDAPIERSHELEQVGKKLHKKLTRNFKQIRSASTSDILDADIISLPDGSLTPDVLELEDVIHASDSEAAGAENTAPSSDNVRNVKKLRHTNSDSSILSSSSQPSSSYEVRYTPIRSGTMATPVSTTEKRKSTSIKGRAKEKVKKSLSSSGKFAHSLIKTARSLRNGSISKQRNITKSMSAEDLLDDGVGQTRSHASVSDPTRFSVSMSPTLHSPTPYEARTLPSKSSRMNTLARLMKGGRSKEPRSHSFGKSDKHARGASWHQADFTGSESLVESIDSVSKNILNTPLPMNVEEQLLISVELASKLQKKQATRLRTSSVIGKESSGNPWFQITVNTNIKEFGRSHYTILRPFKVIQNVCDSLSSGHGGVDLPRPDKKVAAKKQARVMVDLLRTIAGNAHLRKNKIFVNFLMPDDEFGEFTEADSSEVSFERLMTFYTPDITSGPPGSFPSVQMVHPDHVPATPSPDTTRRSTVKGHKKGSIQFMKKDGKEDPSTFVIQEEGEDALIVAYEDDRYVVVAGTFEKLVEQLACEEKPDPRFVTTFLLGYRHFAKALDFLTKLLDRFHMTVPPNATDEEIAYAEKWSYVIQLRVLDILTYWMKKCWPDLYRNPPVLEKVKEFAVSLKATDDHNFQYAGNNIEKIISEKMANSTQYNLSLEPHTSLSSSHSHSHPPHSHSHHSPMSTPTQGRHPLSEATGHTSSTEGGKRSPVGGARSSSSAPNSPRPPSSPRGPNPPRTPSFPRAPGSPRVGGLASGHLDSGRLTSSSSYYGMDICSIPAIQLARQMTLIELEFLRAIDVHELVVFTWDPNIPENKPYRRNLDAFIDRFNQVSYWVASEICCVEDIKLRELLIEKFIDVAKYCHEYKNFNTAISVISGLSLVAVRRLKRSWELVNEKSKKCFAKLQPLTEPTTNHRNYRRALASVHRREACIPYFGVFMRDLTFFNDGNKKRLKNGLYNFSKLRTMVYKFEEVKRYQRSKYFFPPEDKTKEFCHNLWCVSESELYDASLRIEPRDVPSETAV